MRLSAYPRFLTSARSICAQADTRSPGRYDGRSNTQSLPPACAGVRETPTTNASAVRTPKRERPHVTARAPEIAALMMDRRAAALRGCLAPHDVRPSATDCSLWNACAMGLERPRVFLGRSGHDRRPLVPRGVRGDGRRARCTHSTVQTVERTTGFEPATLTLATRNCHSPEQPISDATCANSVH